MKDRSSRQPKLTPSTKEDKAARGDRLAAEMRKNLFKRKQQQRQKSESAPESADAPAELNNESGAPDDHG